MCPGLRVRSYTEGLEDTALAARHKSLLEEYVMRINRALDEVVEYHGDEREV